MTHHTKIAPLQHYLLYLHFYLNIVLCVTIFQFKSLWSVFLECKSCYSFTSIALHLIINPLISSVKRTFLIPQRSILKSFSILFYSILSELWSIYLATQIQNCEEEKRSVSPPGITRCNLRFRWIPNISLSCSATAELDDTIPTEWQASSHALFFEKRKINTKIFSFRILLLYINY